MRKRPYHPFLIIGYKTGILPQTLVQVIPRSTRHHWLHKNLEDTFGHCWYTANEKQLAVLKEIYQSKRLMQLNIALLRLFAVKRFIHRHAAALKQGLQNIPATVYGNIKKSAAVLGTTNALKLLGMAHSKFTALQNKSRCVLSPLGLCRTRHPAQLLPAEAAAIKTVCTDEAQQYWPLSSVYHAALRAGKIVCHISTFYKYAAAMGLRRAMPGSRRPNHHTGIRAAAPLQLIHADVTQFRLTDNSRVFIFVVVDNYSRHLLALQAFAEKKAAHLFDLLRQVHRQHLAHSGHSDCVLLTDDGSENYGEVKNLIRTAARPAIQHLIAQADVDFSNSMAEQAIKELKYQWLYHHSVNTIEQLNKLLQQHLENDRHRPRTVLKGLTPAEALAGRAPESQNYALHLQKAAEIRKIQNKKTMCCGFSF